MKLNVALLFINRDASVMRAPVFYREAVIIQSAAAPLHRFNEFSSR